jgi:hypothetical protein
VKVADENELAARLADQLLADPALRAEFRRDPVAAARRAGLAGLAEELSAVGGDPLQTLALRESRSSLAGVAVAAAVEGIALGLPHDALGSGHAREYGIDAPRGSPPGGAEDLLHNDRVTLDADGIADLRAGRIDPRIVSLLEELSRKHTITVSAMRSDHERLTAGGSVSNHSFGRAVDIATIDGQPVGPANAAAKAIAQRVASLDPAIRPTEIGSPWALPGPAYFTDAAHQNHLHLAYDDPVEDGWRPPAAPEEPRGPTPAVVVDEDADDAGDEDAGDAGDDSDDEDGGEREDGDSGDTEAEADAESDGDEDDEDEDEDDEDEEDEDEDEDEEDEDEDEDEEEHDDSDDGADGDDGADQDGGADEVDDADQDDAADRQDDGPASAWKDPDGDVRGFPGPGAPREDVAAWMAGEARRRGLPAELPVMAALVESGLNNLDGGDADSAGFFQMRLGIWNQGEYAGYPSQPELQLEWFLDHAEAVGKERAARGLPLDDPRRYGEWIADVERPAEQYRGRYQLRLDEARELLEHFDGRPRGAPEGQAGERLKLKLISREEALRARERRG